MVGGFVRAVRLERERVPDFDRYPFSIPAVRALDTLELDPKVTFLVGSVVNELANRDRYFKHLFTDDD